MVTSVTNFGRNGLYDWLIQRISALVIASYVLFILLYLITHPGLQYEQWVGLFQTNLMRIFNSLTLILLVAHIWIGLWGVLTDYVTVRMLGNKATAIRLTLQILMILALLIMLLVGFNTFWRLV